MKSHAFPLSRSFDAIIDVRSPAEFALDHVPGAINLPVMSNEERVVVGSLDRQVSSFEAQKQGAAIAARNIANHLDSFFADKPKSFSALVYCWRGGKRSGSMAHILDQIGFDAAVVKGGYKAFRRYVNSELERLAPMTKLVVIAGKTGSGKTRLLHHMASQGHQVLDLEGLANHRGSILGAAPDASPQPAQKGFETKVWHQLSLFDLEQPIYLEAESSKIGEVHIPGCLFDQMRGAKRVALEAPLAVRKAILVEDYQHLIQDIGLLRPLLAKLKYRHGNEQTQAWAQLAEQGQHDQLIEELLDHHYDPTYSKSGELRPAVQTVEFSGVTEDRMTSCAEAIVALSSGS